MSTKPFTEEQIAYIIELYAPPSILTLDVIANRFKERFNRSISVTTISTILSKRGVLRPYKVIKGVPVYQYTKEQHEFLVTNYAIYDINALTKAFNEAFNDNKNASAIHTYLERHHIYSPRGNGQFKKGNTPFNKGIPQSEWMSEEGMNNCKYTQFNSEKTVNNANYNVKPIGTEFTESDGYTRVKCAEKTGNAAQRYWKMKHLLVWEQYHGPAPKGHKIIFKDGNRSNFDINNLTCVPNNVHLRMNQYKYYNHTPEITEAGIAVCESEIAYYKLMKGE